MYKHLRHYIEVLEKAGELVRIKAFADPVLEMAEITDRFSKSPGGGKALLFENTGTPFPVLTNMMGSEKRMALALGVDSLEEPARRIEALFARLTAPGGTLSDKLRMLPLLKEMADWMPRSRKGKGACQQVVHRDGDVRLSMLPVLKCWPCDGGRFVTLPLVHTRDPETGVRNVGMYRMQVFSDNAAGMHWHRHKTGERHYEGYRRQGRRMPVSVCLGGDPVHTYAATAPVPDNVDEYLLAGFLRRRPVELVRCLTNDLEVPADCDFVIEGYVDPAEPKATEGPFGDHTGFYSLEDEYPVFHVTCITHRRDAVWPATLVGIPPQEDAWIARATERLFLAPLRLAALPEMRDLWLPAEGVAHNLAVANIDKTYPGQGFKAAASLWGAGQMMFNKFLILTSSDRNVRTPEALKEALNRTLVPRDVLISKGPADVLDHTAPAPGFGGKLCLDATAKLPEESGGRAEKTETVIPENPHLPAEVLDVNAEPALEGWGLLILRLSHRAGDARSAVREFLENNACAGIRFILAIGEEMPPDDYAALVWLAGNNIDPGRDVHIEKDCLVLDARAKTGGLNGFSRRWPNVVTMDRATVRETDRRWEEWFPGLDLMPSPSEKYRGLVFSDGAAAE